MFSYFFFFLSMSYQFRDKVFLENCIIPIITTEMIVMTLVCKLSTTQINNSSPIMRCQLLNAEVTGLPSQVRSTPPRLQFVSAAHLSSVLGCWYLIGFFAAIQFSFRSAPLITPPSALRHPLNGARRSHAQK